jgi:hypothetical protein
VGDGGVSMTEEDICNTMQRLMDSVNQLDSLSKGLSRQARIASSRATTAARVANSSSRGYVPPPPFI